MIFYRLYRLYRNHGHTHMSALRAAWDTTRRTI